MEFTKWQASRTALSAVLPLWTVLNQKTKPGLYMPELVCTSDWFLRELMNAGATIHNDLG